MEKIGGCLCGAVRFEACNVPGTFTICHCEQCRRWTGSALLEVSIKTEDLTWHGDEHIAIHASSGWAERAWCKDCGTNLYFRHTQEDKWFGSTALLLGLFDDANGFLPSHEIFADQKPDSFAYAEVGQKHLTHADVIALRSDIGSKQ